MDATAKITAKGQITVPKAVHDALGVREGDTLVFRVENGRASVAATVDLLDLAGVVGVPEDVAGLPWEEIRRRAWAARGRAVAR